uniref:RNA-directed DNA polymerase n=1 Tax=Tanacetum cinerariifolium TaxID=118510 RepID=A0A6L2LB01_TANCI|nr:ORFIII-like polyprotein [Tanacetum cinerariifolium]
MSRLNCPKCQLTSCALCAQNYLGKTVNVKRKQQHKPEEEKDFSSNEVRLLKELLKEKTEQLKAKQIKLEKEKDEEIRRLKAQLQEKKDKEIKFQFSKEEFPPLRNSQIARPFMEAEAHYSGSTTTAPKIRKITNQLYNVKVKFEIPNCPMFGTTAIIDTRASACCINKKVIPEEALEPLTQTVFFNGLNSRQQATYRIKQGYFLIEGNKFKIPLLYVFDMRDGNGIKMLIEANFLRSMRGGIRIKGDEITIYKKVTRIKTSNQTEIVEIAELEVSEEEFLEINESIYFNQEGSKAFLEQFKPVMDRLKHQGYIGEEPLKHWKKNGELFPGGLYEWLVMPFGLKNAPAVFQRKMDKCFKGTESFIAVYIDDILVFSENEKEHAKHLEKMLKICEDNGLVLSLIKMKIAVSTIDFFGTKKGLRSFLGILNYARNHIPKLGILLRPLYGKTNAHGDKRMKSSDYELVRKIKEQVQNLPDLEIPPENAYIILETNGCMDGWGGIIKWKKSKEDPRECTGEMKELAAAAIHSAEEVLQSSNAFQKNMKITCEEVMKICNTSKNLHKNYLHT